MNIFAPYVQRENQFTNGLISILDVSNLEGPRLVNRFLSDGLGLVPAGEVDTFRVLRGIKGTADGELCGEDCRILFETKIASGMLDKVQLGEHLKQLRSGREGIRKLVLLTPEDSKSNYVQRYRSIDPDCILHLAWKRVSSLLEDFVRDEAQSVLSELVRQLIVQIHKMVFEQDFAGIIQKIHFGDQSTVYAERYLEEMRARGTDGTRLGSTRT